MAVFSAPINAVAVEKYRCLGGWLSQAKPRIEKEVRAKRLILGIELCGLYTLWSWCKPQEEEDNPSPVKCPSWAHGYSTTHIFHLP